jgi:Ca2+-binding RTX toxin-like protein
VTIDVTAVDDAPVAPNVTGSVDEGATPALSGTLVATDVDNDDTAITYAVDTAVAGFTLASNGDWEFDATDAAYNSLAAGETQVVSTTYTATSNGQTDTGTITITVTGTNDAPVATAVSVAGVEDTVAAGLVVATDVDNGDTLTYSVEAGDEPTNGDVTMNQNGSFEYTPDANFNGTDTFTYTVTDSQGATATAAVTVTVAAASDELTTGIDIFVGSVANDIVTGNENTLNSGDNVVGGEGEDTVIINVDTGVDGPLAPILPPVADDFTFGGFSLDVETFQTTIDGEGSATFDMSGSEITGNTFVNSNSSADVTYNSVNMTAGGTNGDDNGDGLPDDLFSLELLNVTNSADTTVTTRPAQVSGTTDAANILATNVDSNAIIGDVNFFGAPGTTTASGIETFNLSTAGSPQPVVIEDLNTPGARNLNIAADTTGLTIGDNDNDVAISGDPFGQRDVDGFEFALSSTINNVNGSASTGGFGLSLEAASGNVTVTGGDGNDTIEGSNNNDVISGGLGNDILDGDDGNDIINGGVGNDTLLGSSGADTINGGDNNDVIEGGNGNDVLNGDAGNDNIHTGINAADEIVNAGADNDNVTTNVQFLDGTDENGGSLDLVDQLDGGSGFDNLFLEGSASTDVNGLNFVQGFENIELDGSGAQTFTIGNNSLFEAEHDTRVLGGGDETTVDGRSAGGSLNLDFTTLNAKMNVIDSSNNDTIVGSRGDDDIFFSTGIDNLVGGLGDDEFIGEPDNIEFNDTIDGDSGDDTIVARGRGTANLGANIVGIETLKAEDAGSQNGADLTVNIGDGTAPNNFTNNDTTTTFHDGTPSNGGNPRIHIDGSDLDLGEELLVNFLNTIDEDIQVTGGASNDIVNMGTFLDAGDQIEGGLNSAVNVNSGVFGDVVVIDLAGGSLTDAALAGLSGIETLRVIDSVGGGTLTLATNAMNAGIQVVDASGVTTNGTTINATAFTNDLTVLDGPGNLTINTDGGNDTILLNTGTDNINTGGGADTIQIENGELDFSDTIEGGTGADTVVLMNNTGPAAGITANVDLTNVTGLETYTMEGDGNRGGGGFEADTHNINFQNGNVGTVTPILINSSNVLDTLDTLNVTLAGGLNAVDADFFFTVTGGAGIDTFTKNNFGLNNNIDWDGGEGQDIFSIAGGDLGASTTINGGDGVDTLEQLQGAFIDDDFINVSSMENLTVGGANTMLMATLGAEADDAGIVTIQGGSGNDNVLLDAAFDNDLTVNMDNPQASPGNGGDDTINGAASQSAITFVGTAEDFTSGDQLTGGSGTTDVANILFDGVGPNADVSNMNGVETINVQAPSGGAAFTLTLGNTTTDFANNALVINEAAFDWPAAGTNVGDQAFVGDTLNVQGAAYTGDITFNGENDSAVSNVTTGSGDDLVNGGSLGDTLITNGGEDTVNGEAGDDVINSGANDDTVNGGTGDDTIDGGTGDDSIDGGENDDLITGGQGEDTLTGGNGADDFRYVTVSESQGIPNDIITDFEAGVDEILIEENVLVQAGGGATSVAAAPLGFNAPSFGQAVGAISGTENDGIADWVFQAADGGDPATLWIDTNDDGLLTGLDLQIELQGVTALQAGDVKLIDTILPAAPTIDSIADDTGAASDDFITQDDTLIVTIGLPTGAGDGTDAKAGDTLTVFHPGIAGGSTDITLTQVDIDAGEYAFDITAIPLADGDYDFSAQITDELGVPQAGPVSAVQTITVDNAATITIVDVANDDVDDGFINAAEDDAVIANGTTTDVEAGATVTVTFDDGSNPVVTATATVDGSGNWAITAADNVDVSGLNEGNITVSADVTDLAGNMANDSDVLVKDTLVTVNLQVVDGGGVTNAAEETSSVYVGSSSDTEGLPITVSVSGVSVGLAAGGELASSTEPSPGAFGDTDDLSIYNFDEGSIVTYTATVTDQAGNVATATDTTVIDTVGPQATITSATFDYAAGTIVFNGTFDPADIVLGELASGAFNGTLINWDDGDGSDVSIEQSGVFNDDIVEGSTAVSATALTIQLETPGGTSGPGEWGRRELLDNASLAEAAEDVLDLIGGSFEDVNGNPSVQYDDIPIGLIISTADLASTTLVGGSVGDTLTASAAGDTLTGNDGDDTFVMSAAVLGTPIGLPSDGGDVAQGPAAATITDLDVTGTPESDLIQFSGADLDAAIFAANGAVTTYGVPGGTALNFQTYVGGTAGAATNQEGTIIFDAVNEQVRIDINGDTVWTGAEIDNNGVANDTGDDDVIIDVTGVSGTLDASDFSIV